MKYIPLLAALIFLTTLFLFQIIKEDAKRDFNKRNDAIEREIIGY